MSSLPHRAGAQQRQLPAFGRELLDLRRRGLVPQRHPFLGHAVLLLDNWRWARVFDPMPARLVVPEDRNPSGLDLSPVAGLDVTLAWSRRYTTQERMEGLRDALLTVPVEIVQVFEMDREWTPGCWFAVRPEKGA